MHFRVRKSVIQLIRVDYDSRRRKGVNRIVGTVSLSSPQLSESLRDELSSQEVDEFHLWLNTRHREERLREELAGLTLPTLMAQAERWFEREGDSQATRLAAAAVVAQWQSLRRLLVKKGFLD